MAIAIVALLAFGGSYAYFTATADNQSASITMGTVKLASNAEFSVTAEDVMPGDTVGHADGLVLTVTTEDDAGNWVAIKPEVTGSITGFTIAAPDASVWEQIGSTGIYITKARVANGQTAAAYVGGFTISTDVEGNWDQTSGNAAGSAQGATVTLTVTAKSIQGSNLDNIEDAKVQLATEFGTTYTKAA